MEKISYQDESEIEARLIDVLGEGRNQWTYRPDLKSEEDLWNNLRQKITYKNLSELGEVLLTDKEFELIKTQILSRTQTPFDAGKWLRGENGIARVTIDREDMTLGQVSLVVNSNQDINGGTASYEVVHQIAKNRSSIENRDRRFDVTLLINGLPIIQIELKKVNAKDGIYQAFNQVKKYAEEGLFRNNIFSTLQLFVVSNEKTTRYFANAMPKDMHRKFLFSWRTTDNKKVDNLYEFSKQVLNIPDAHHLVALYTILSEDQDNRNLMVLHPYQIHAIEALFQAASQRKSGYVWHATGSGKTVTSFVSTKLLARANGIHRTVMLVDRKDLDNQTTSEFTKFASEYNTGISTGSGKSNTLIVGTGSSKELSDTLLADANSNVVIITTRQKLDAAMKYARNQEEKNGTNRYKKLIGQRIAFIVDECHRAISPENMEEIKAFFPNSLWYGFTGTPIFEVNKKQAKGQLARTTDDQYGDVLHTYTIKNALEDGSVLGFQVEHEDTIEPISLNNQIHRELRAVEKYVSYSPEQLNKVIDEFDNIKKESFIKPTVYERDEHVEKVIRKIFRPDNAYTKFDFKNGKPQKSAILTTSSIAMAKKYYAAIKAMTAQEDWMEKEFSKYPIRTGRTMDDPDFPRIAITYSLDENDANAKDQQDEMTAIIAEYNAYYNTAWSLSDIERYNGDINNRLARKKAEFKQFGKQVDLVIVVDRLLTGFDAPTVQTLFMDRTMEYAGLIQAFSRTNRTYPEKTKGLIVTFRKPFTMEKNVEEATKLYSEAKEEAGLIYPTYKESKEKFEAAYRKIREFVITSDAVDEHTNLEARIEYVKAYQALSNAYEALVTYDDYNDESTELKDKVFVLEEQMGVYQTVKGSILVEEPDGPETDLSEIEFFSGNSAKLYDIDATYIDQLLGTYYANSPDVRDEIETAMMKLNKAEIVRKVYRDILDAIDSDDVDENADIFSIKRLYFTKAKNTIIHKFAEEWAVDSDPLYSSAVQYTPGAEVTPNIGNIIDGSNFEVYKQLNPDAKRFKYPQDIKRAWRIVLDEAVIPLENELR
ncbi:type I restriction endonuclease subunit R [Jeotgalibaca porci]|uniref:type I restriction endonuclease subunit R n=1 Tax=Jeotgalibaca porci TaxID=1868793 RepID=UPI0035A0C604